MYIAFNAPHDPRQAPRDYLAKYPAEKMAVPVNFQPQYPYCNEIGCSPKLRDEHLMPFPRTEFATKVHRREYFALITHLDAQIGRILDALEKSGKADNTWIVFTADHGLAVGQHGLVGKQNMYDHSVRVPFIVVGPGVDAGKKIDSHIYLQDVMPTTLELADVEKPDHVEFESLLPLLRGETNEHYEATYGAYLAVQRMVTYDGYKLILYPQAKVWRLYNVAEDPHELHDLAEQPESLPVAKTLFEQLLRLQESTGDQLDLRETFPAISGSS
ncbi:MAG: sulfatase-like hydrolase/transferase, partial [Planctomycetaceae bacterium]|nr:sulfatase-like hydrolase/transferase [Planctomycetaceae bacterium]